MKKLLGYSLFAGLFLLIGMFLADTEIGEATKSAAKSARSRRFVIAWPARSPT